MLFHCNEINKSGWYVIKETLGDLRFLDLVYVDIEDNVLFDNKLKCSVPLINYQYNKFFGPIPEEDL